MLRIFQNFSLPALLSLLIYFAGLSVHVFLNPVEADFSNATPVSDLVFDTWTGMKNLPHTSLLIIILSCIFLQGIAICFFLQQFKITQKLSLIPAVAYYLFCFLFEDFISFFPLLVLNFILFFLLSRIFSIYNKQKADGAIFDIGLIIAFVMLFYFPAALFIGYILLVISILRSTSFREIFIFFSAIIVVYFLTVTVFFWYDSLPLFLKQFPVSHLMQRSVDGLSTVLIIKLSLCVMFLAAALLFLNKKYSTSVVQVRKYFTCLILYGVFIIASAALASSVNLRTIFPVVLPAGILAAYFFMNIKNREAAEIVHLTLLGIVLTFQYITFA